MRAESGIAIRRTWSIRYLMVLVALVAVDVALLRMMYERRFKDLDVPGVLLMAVVQAAAIRGYSCRVGIREGWFSLAVSGSVVLGLYAGLDRFARYRMVFLGRVSERDVRFIVGGWITTIGPGTSSQTVALLAAGVRYFVPLLAWTVVGGLLVFGGCRLVRWLLPRLGELLKGNSRA